jgi:hypothetical protein
MSASNPNQSGGTTSLLRIARTECRAAVAFLALPVDENMFATATYPVLSEEDVVSVTALDELLHEIWDDAELAPGKVLIHSVQAGSRRLVRSKRTEVALVRLDNGPDGRPLGLLGVAGPSGGVFGNDIHGLGALADRVSSYLRARQQVRHWVTHDPSGDAARTAQPLTGSAPQEPIGTGESPRREEPQPAMPESLAEAISSDFEPQLESSPQATPEPEPEPETPPVPEVVRLTERMAARVEAAKSAAKSEPEPVVEPELVVEPEAVVEPEPESVTEAEPVAEQDAVAAPEAAAEPEAVEEAETVDEPEAAAEPEVEAAETVEAPQTVAAPEPEQASEPKIVVRYDGPVKEPDAEPEVVPEPQQAVEPAAIISPSTPDAPPAAEPESPPVEPEVVVSETITTASQPTSAVADPIQELLTGNDPVTGLPPLASLLGRIGRMLGAAQSTDAALAVIAIEFTGPEASDDGQRAAADALHAQLRFDDPVARLGQYVFATALPFVTGITSGENLERGLTDAVKAAVASSGSDVEIHAAHIVASLAGGDDADQLLRSAVEKLRAR